MGPALSRRSPLDLRWAAVVSDTARDGVNMDGSPDDPRLDRWWLRRRAFLELLGASGLALSVGELLPGCGSSSHSGARRFFSAAQRSTMDALAAALVPEDETVGAVGAGAVEYLDRMLAAFDHPEPDVFRSGPFSGRVPYPDPASGDASRSYPPDSFRNVLPMTRLQEAAFRIAFFGSDAVENGNVNAPIVPATSGWIALYRDGLAQLDQIAASRGATFGDLAPNDRLDAFDQTPSEWRDAVLDHLCEGMFCAPEYGGNSGAIAWQQYHFDGDSQPLGHTLHDPATGEPRDRPDQPNQTLDPNRPNDAFPADVERVLTVITLAQRGKRFF